MKSIISLFYHSSYLVRASAYTLATLALAGAALALVMAVIHGIESAGIDILSARGMILTYSIIIAIVTFAMAAVMPGQKPNAK